MSVNLKKSNHISDAHHLEHVDTISLKCEYD